MENQGWGKEHSPEEKCFVSDEIAVVFSMKHSMSKLMGHHKADLTFRKILVQKYVPVIFQKHVTPGAFSKISILHFNIQIPRYFKWVICPDFSYVVCCYAPYLFSQEHHLLFVFIRIVFLLVYDF